MAEGRKGAHWNRRQRNKGVEMVGVNTQHKAEKLVRSLQSAGCLEKAKTCFDCFSSCSCQVVLYSASLAPLPLRLPQSALWWITAGDSSSCRCSLSRGKLISSTVSSFWLEILWMIDNLQAPAFPSITRSSKELAACAHSITEECNKNLPERGKQTQQEDCGWSKFHLCTRHFFFMFRNNKARPAKAWCCRSDLKY